jgi:Arc/MetJ-type ribon-helix-helix transcriptional regulator
LIRKLDRWVREGRYPNRSQAAQAALELLERRNRLPTLDEALEAYRRLKPEQKRRLEAEAVAIEQELDAVDPWPAS